MITRSKSKISIEKKGGEEQENKKEKLKKLIYFLNIRLVENVAE